MKHPILLLLLLPLHAFAQYRPSYSPPRPSYTPAPVRPGPSPSQMQHQSQQLAHQNFQRQQAQQMQNMQSTALRNQQAASLRQQQYQQQLQQQRLMQRQPLTPQQLEQQQARQREAEDQATDYLARFAQDQQSLRLTHPATDAAQAAAQQQQDARQLTAVTVKAYREVFLPGQMTAALQSLSLSAKGQQALQSINHDLLDKAWWSKQEPAALNGKIAAHGNALAALTGELLGFDLASPPPPSAPAPTIPLDNMLARDTFDPLVAAQLLREAAAAEKVIAGDRLAKAVTEFKTLSNNAAARPELQSDVKASLRKVNKEMQRYDARVGTSGRLYTAQKTVLKSTAGYLAKNGK